MYFLQCNKEFLFTIKNNLTLFLQTGLSGNVIILSVLYYGGVMVSDANITVGNLSSFLLYAAYIGVSLGGLSTFYSELNRGLGASTRLWEIIDRVPTVPYKGKVINHYYRCIDLKIKI